MDIGELRVPTVKDEPEGGDLVSFEKTFIPDLLEIPTNPSYLVLTWLMASFLVVSSVQMIVWVGTALLVLKMWSKISSLERNIASIQNDMGFQDKSLVN